VLHCNQEAKCFGFCNTSPCYSNLGCGFDCVCMKEGGESRGTCVRFE